MCRDFALHKGNWELNERAEQHGNGNDHSFLHHVFFYCNLIILLLLIPYLYWESELALDPGLYMRPSSISLAQVSGFVNLSFEPFRECLDVMGGIANALGLPSACPVLEFSLQCLSL
jgi:hypothetical protein